MARIRKTKAQLEAEKIEASRQREERTVNAIAQAIGLVKASDNAHDMARLVLLTIQAGKVPGVKHFKDEA